jgi:hypothetical protein
MNNKFFGNSLDLFKYDLLTFLTKLEKSNLFYLAMLTKPEPKKLDPKYKLFEVGFKNEILFKFIKDINSSESKLQIKDLTNYFNSVDVEHKIVLNKNFGYKNVLNFENIEYFENENREKYFSYAIDIYKSQNSKTLLFLDADVGIDLGVKRRVRSMKHMYLNSDEIHRINGNLKKNDFLCFFQHLGNPQFKLEERLNFLKNEFGKDVLLFAYERISACLVFIFNDELNYLKIKKHLLEYVKQYEEIKHFQRIKLI